MRNNNENYRQNMEQKRHLETDKIDAKALKTKEEEGRLREKMAEEQAKKEK